MLTSIVYSILYNNSKLHHALLSCGTKTSGVKREIAAHLNKERVCVCDYVCTCACVYIYLFIFVCVFMWSHIPVSVYYKVTMLDTLGQSIACDLSYVHVTQPKFMRNQLFYFENYPFSSVIHFIKSTAIMQYINLP